MASVNELLDMTGRTAIVTGGGTHLGNAMAETLCELGAAVYIASRRGDLCEQVAAEMRAKSSAVPEVLEGPQRRSVPSPSGAPWAREGQGVGRGQESGHGAATIRPAQGAQRPWDITGLACDATKEDQVNALVDRVIAERGRLDVMIANAGGGRPTSYPPHGKLSEFVQALEINMVSTYLCAQAAARAMVPARKGSIITLGSIAATLGTDRRTYGPEFTRSGPHYMAAKGGVLQLTRALACEFGEWSITVNCISPGQIPKPGVVAPAQVERFRQMNPLQRTGTRDDIKGVVAVLASDAGRWITGQNFLVDGGWSIW
jgi:NAD(P)-dependent dehydrogenase (short-subunit alcohol dehydrogenase family)